MMGRGLERITGLAALAMIGLMIGTLATWGNPQLTDPIGNITGYYVKQHDQALLSAFFAMLGGVAGLIFGSGIRSLLYSAEGEPHTLSTVVFGTVVVATLWSMVWASMNGGLAMIAGRASEGEIRLLLSLEYYVDYMNFLASGLFMSAVSLALLRTRIFRWIAWLGVASGVLLLVGTVGLLNPIGSIGAMGDIGMGGLLLDLIWTGAVGIRLLIRPVPLRNARQVGVTAGACP
jgi:hypothetical protein